MAKFYSAISMSGYFLRMNFLYKTETGETQVSPVPICSLIYYFWFKAA